MGMAGGARLQVEDQGKSLVDPLHLLDGQEADRLGEVIEIHGGELVTHDQGLPIGRRRLTAGSWSQVRWRW